MKRVMNLEGMNLLQSNYAIAGQEVPHFHMHLIPRKKDDGLKMIWNRLTMSQEDLGKIATSLRL